MLPSCPLKCLQQCPLLQQCVGFFLPVLSVPGAPGHQEETRKWDNEREFPEGVVPIVVSQQEMVKHHMGAVKTPRPGGVIGGELLNCTELQERVLCKSFSLQESSSAIVNSRQSWAGTRRKVPNSPRPLLEFLGGEAWGVHLEGQTETTWHLELTFKLLSSWWCRIEPNCGFHLHFSDI